MMKPAKQLVLGSISALTLFVISACAAPVASDFSAADPSGSAGPSSSAPPTGSPQKSPGANPVGASVTPTSKKGSSGSTGISMTVVNNTSTALNLLTSSNPYGNWQQRPTPTLAVGQSVTVSDESANIYGAQISLTYATPQGAGITLTSTTPLAGSDSSSSKITYPPNTSTPQYLVMKNSPGGYHSTDNFVITEGQLFSMTGAPQTYTVPSGVSKVAVNAVGASGGDGGTGADITGVLTVTPGEVLTIGVGGRGASCGTKNAGGGFGIQLGANNYGGGGGRGNDSQGCGAPGGGASVVADGSGTVVTVAGGGGGKSWASTGGGFGGSAGYQGSLTGQNGGNYIPGIAGGAAGTTGQSSAAATWPGGGGGGGFRGGTAGNQIQKDQSSGGGSGSSFDAGLSDPTVNTALLGGDGYVTISPVVN